MPACRECEWFDEATFSCRMEARSRKPNRACTDAIFYKHGPSMRGEILEVGHGVCRVYRRYLLSRGLRWKGIDPRWPDDPRNHRWQATVSHIPFPDCSQDWVFCLNCMEHWEEYGDSLADGMRELHRIVKPGGKLLITVPIYWHGGDEFYFCRLKEIESLFDTKWTDTHFEAWRRDHVPLQPHHFWAEGKNKRRRMALMQQLHFSPPSSYTLEIYAEKR